MEKEEGKHGQKLGNKAPSLRMQSFAKLVGSGSRVRFLLVRPTHSLQVSFFPLAFLSSYLHRNPAMPILA